MPILHTIGDRRTTYSHTFLLPIGQKAVLFGELDQGAKLNIEVTAVDSSEKTEAGTSWELATNTPNLSQFGMTSGTPLLKVTLTNWSNALGMTHPTPIKVGQMGNGQPIGMNLFAHRAADILLVTFELYVGGQY